MINSIGEVFNYTNLTIGGVCTVIIKWLGGGDDILLFLLLLFITEYFTSLYLSWKKLKQITKRDRFMSIIQKVLILWIIVVGVFLDKGFGIDMQSLNIRNMLISCFIGYEGLTIFENYDIMGLRLPEGLRQFFLKLINYNRSGGE